jgi:hypothetical protein
MGAQQSSAALQQIAMGGGFAPALMQQPPMQHQPMQQHHSVQAMSMQQAQAPMQQAGSQGMQGGGMPQQAVQYVAVQQPMQYASMQPGYAYVLPGYATAGVLWHGSHPGACAVLMPVDAMLVRPAPRLKDAARLAPQTPAGMQVQAMPSYQPTYQPMEQMSMPAAPLPPQAVKRPLTITSPDDGMHMQPMQHAQAAYHPGYGGEGAQEALPQRPGAGASRRYSTVARQGM